MNSSFDTRGISRPLVIAVFSRRLVEKRYPLGFSVIFTPIKKETVMMRKTFRISCLLMLSLCLTTMFISASWASYTKTDKAIERISPEDARKLGESGQALLVCSYSDDRCKSRLLQGALLKSELDARLASLSKDTQIIFYCG